MNRMLLAAVPAVALALAACPIPQPLAEVARSADGGAVSTPTILPDTAQPADTVVLVKPDCDPPPQFTMSITLEDLDTDESVEARWFADYGSDHALLLADDGVSASSDTSNPQRLLIPVAFSPYASGVPPDVNLHVVEVVVSNGFLALNDPTPPLQRAAAPPFVTQSYRWVFQYDPAGRCQ